MNEAAETPTDAPPAASPPAESAATPLPCQATEVTHTWKYTSPLIGCRFSPDGQRVVTTAQDRQIQVWELATGAHRVLTGHESWLQAVGFSLDGQTLYSAGYEGALLVWDLNAEQPQPVRRLAAHDGWIRGLVVSPDGQRLATGGNDHHVKLWNAASGELVHDLLGHEAHVYSLLFHPTENLLLSADLLGKIMQWDLADGKLVRTLAADDLHVFFGGQGAHYGGVRGLSFSPDHLRLACSGLYKASNPFGAVQEPLVVVLDWTSGSKQQSHIADGIAQGICWRSVYHSSGTLIGVSGGGSGGHLLFWQPAVEKAYHQFALPNIAFDLDLSPVANLVVTAHHDGHVRVSTLK